MTKKKKIILIISIIFVVFLVGTTIFLIMINHNDEIPKTTETKKEEVKKIFVPDVENMSLKDTVELLTGLGLKISEKKIVQSSENILENHIIKTIPDKSTEVDFNTEIILYVSSGPLYIMENFVGVNYQEAKNRLEANDIVVVVEKEIVEQNSSFSENRILRQSVTPGTTLKKQDVVTIYIPIFNIKTYPNFVSKGSTEADVQAFCDENGIKLEIEYVETSEYIAGEVFYQSRPEGYTVADGQTLKIKIATKSNNNTSEQNECNVPGLC